jgi:hypothetical protein
MWFCTRLLFLVFIYWYKFIILDAYSLVEMNSHYTYLSFELQQVFTEHDVMYRFWFVRSETLTAWVWMLLYLDATPSFVGWYEHATNSLASTLKTGREGSCERQTRVSKRHVSVFKEREVFKTAYYSELSLIGWWAVTSLAPHISTDTTLPLKEVASIYFQVFHNVLNEPSCAKDVTLFAVNCANKWNGLTIISSSHTKKCIMDQQRNLSRLLVPLLGVVLHRKHINHFSHS